MDTSGLRELLEAYENAPREYHATRYWRAYHDRILAAVEALDVDQLRSGRYPILSTFGFNDTVYAYHPNLPLWKKAALKAVHRVTQNRSALPYSLDVTAIREMAYRHCELLGELTRSRPVAQVGMSDFGNPADRFEIGGQLYSVQFLGYFVRYCFANKHLRFAGDEVVVELGPGCGYQIEILMKLYPDLTVLCFDLPTQIFLCETYLSRALEPHQIVGTGQTLGWSDLSSCRPGAVHFFGNWQVPLLRDLEMNLFWNAASFGEMEPAVVENYLSHVLGRAEWVYLLQARHGKETTGTAHVDRPIAFGDYDALLTGYELEEEQDAYLAHRRLADSGGYFEALWRRERG